MKINLDLRFWAAPEIATAILPPNWRDEGGGGGPLLVPEVGVAPEELPGAAREAREPEEMEAATRSKSTPGGVDPAPTWVEITCQGG